MNMLDEFAFEALDELSGACRTSGLSSIGTRAQPAGSAFSNWCGWSVPITLGQMTSGPVPDYFTAAAPALYRITFPGVQGPYIGMTDRRTIRERVLLHANQRSRGERRVFDRINANRAASNSAVRIQAGFLRNRMSIRETHMYEIWLQTRERVFDWNFIRNTRTFE